MSDMVPPAPTKSGTSASTIGFFAVFAISSARSTAASGSSSSPSNDFSCDFTAAASPVGGSFDCFFVAAIDDERGVLLVQCPPAENPGVWVTP